MLEYKVWLILTKNLVCSLSFVNETKVHFSDEQLSINIWLDNIKTEAILLITNYSGTL